MDKKLLKWNFIFQYGYVLTNIFNSILLLPLYLNNIDKDTLGVWLVTGNILGWITLVDPGVGEILQQRIAKLRGQNEHGEIGKTIGSGLMASGFILFVSIVVGFVFYIFIDLIINKKISSYANLPIAIIISILATGLSLVSFSISGINQGLHNSAQVAICSLSANFLFLFVNLVCLYLGWGVLSIAFANLSRAVYICLFNMISLWKAMKRESLILVFNRLHFRKFVRIFSFTSASKIITGLSNSIEMIVLGRYLLPSMITTYEINKRPINITYSLIGRHSVALMPLISNWEGKGDKPAILDLISKQFRFYSYATLFACFIFLFNYENLITTWTGPGQYAGNTIIFLLIISFFLSLISYYMATIGYALGDIKMNSLYNIIRNIIFGFLMFFAAKNFGIIGTISLSIIVTFVSDVFFYAYRLRKMGYLDGGFMNTLFRYWLIIIPLSLGAGWLLQFIINELIPSGMVFTKLVTTSGSFSLFFITLILLIDGGLRRKTKSLANKYLVLPLSRSSKAS